MKHIEDYGDDVIGRVSKKTFLALVQTLFWTGLRIGEAVATRERFMNFSAGVLDVSWQLDQKGVTRLPKYDKKRKTHVPKQGLKHFSDWVNAPDRDHLDRKQGTKKLGEFCEKVFKDSIHHISFHGLRHSYAGVMLRHFEGPTGKRFTLDDVADFLGDHPWTAKKFYTGFIPDGIAFERAKQITDNELVA